MNTEQNYGEGVNYATSTSQTVENDPQPATLPNYRRIRSLRQQNFDALHQTLGTLTSERSGSDYVEMLGDMLDGYLRGTKMVSEPGEEVEYQFDDQDLDRIWATTRLMAHLVRIDETWSSIQRGKKLSYPR